MKRVHEGLYMETKEVNLNGKKVKSDFEVYKIRMPDPKDPKNLVETPLWGWRSSKIKLYPNDVFESKKDAIESMEQACTIGFKSLPVQATMLAIY